MGFIHDAIMESNKLEDSERFQKVKNPPQLKGRKKPKKYSACATEEIKEGIVKDAIEKVGDTAEKVSKVCNTLTEEEKVENEKIEEAMVDIEQYLDAENYTESLHLNESRIELPDRPMKGRPGSPEYDANDNRRKRVAMYRKYANLDETFEITEENINKRAFDKTCTMQNCARDRLMAELLRKPYTGLERYEED